jgi:type IV pilus assembly protein PilF
MTMAMAARGRFTAGWLAAAALAGVLGTTLAGCAAPQPGHETNLSDVVTPSEETDARRRARIRLQLASSYYEEGKTAVALDELKQVLAVDPSFSDAYNLRGLIYMRLRENALAEDSFKRALALNPRDADANHNYGWLQCELGRYPEAARSFDQALANPLYGSRSKTLMAQGICYARAGRLEEAERSLARSYELDAGNPITGYNLANLLFRKRDFERAQFYIRRLNNSELANAESLWLGIKVERRMNDTQAMGQLAEQLRKRFPNSRERVALDKGAFDE